MIVLGSVRGLQSLQESHSARSQSRWIKVLLGWPQKTDLSESISVKVPSSLGYAYNVD